MRGVELAHKGDHMHDDGLWPPHEGGGQPDEVELSPQGQLAALPDQRAWPGVLRNRKTRIFMGVLWAYFVAHGTYLIVNYLFFSHH
jgi:hypothetical protein